MNIDMSNMVVICATQRSGSTMVLEDLRGTNLAGMPEEYFIPWDPSKKGVDWKKQFNNILEKSRTPNGVSSVKIMSDQLNNLEACLKLAFEGEIDINSECSFPYFSRVFAGAKFIFIRRENILKQAISRYMALKTGVNHATAKSSDEHFAGNLLKGYSSAYNAEVEYDGSYLSNSMVQIIHENLVWEKVYNDMGVNSPLVLVYEQFSKNWPGYLNRISALLKVEFGNDIPKRKMVKLSNQTNAAFYKRYMREYLESSA